MENQFSKAFEPFAGPGFFACFVEPGLRSSNHSHLVIYRHNEDGITRHLNLPLDGDLVAALPPLFDGERLQLLGCADRGLLALTLPIAETAGG